MAWRCLLENYREACFEVRGGMAASQMRVRISSRKPNADDMAGIITYIAPVEKASGKIFGKKTKWVAVTRKKGNRMNGCAVNSPRSTKPSASELAHRQKFGAVAVATQARLINPQYAPQDKAAYAAQKDKYNSLYQYVFRQEWVAYDKPQDVG